MKKRYKIIRFRFKANNRTIKKGLSLEEAQAHCNNPKSSGKDWFDGYTEEKSAIDYTTISSDNLTNWL